MMTVSSEQIQIDQRIIKVLQNGIIWDNGAIATIICGAIIFLSGAYISFLNIEERTTLKLGDVDSTLEPCLKAMPGVCERKCAFSVEQMGINWGSIIP